VADTIHHQSSQEYYSLSKQELALLANKSSSIWKELFLFFSALSIPAILNALSEYSQQPAGWQVIQLTTSLFLNSLIGILTSLLSVVFGIIWWRQTRGGTDLMQEILGKPELPLRVSEEGEHTSLEARYLAIGPRLELVDNTQ
jgi:hypothetical protein